jgi:hypothetical protein
VNELTEEKATLKVEQDVFVARKKTLEAERKVQSIITKQAKMAL